MVRLVEFNDDKSIRNTIELHPEDAEFNATTRKYDPLTAHTYTPDGGETVRHFRLDVQKASFVATAFENGTTGWKFLSVPITPERADPFVNFGDDIDPFKLYKYDTETSGYKIYPLDLGEVGLQTGHGYFTRLSEDIEIDVGGASNNDDIELELADAGWHAIGNPFVKAVNVADLKITVEQTVSLFDQAVDDGLIEETLYRWNVDPGNSDAYQEVAASEDAISSVLEPWDGLWFKTNEDDLTLTIPAPAGLGGYTAPLPPSYDPPAAPAVVDHLARSGSSDPEQLSIVEDMRQVKFVELDTQQFITKETFEIRAERFEMSPLEDLSVVVGEEKVAFKWAANDNPFITGYEILRSTQDDIVSYAIRSTQHEFVDTAVIEETAYTYQISVHYKTGAELKSELFTVTVLPTIEKTALLQNYPNPFNPETWIPYDLESEADVAFEIYNVSGQIVRTLELGVQPRGRYSCKEKAAYWDGRNRFGERVASGVYFYVMKADGFVSTKKMLILK